MWEEYYHNDWAFHLLIIAALISWPVWQTAKCADPCRRFNASVRWSTEAALMFMQPDFIFIIYFYFWQIRKEARNSRTQTPYMQGNNKRSLALNDLLNVCLHTLLCLWECTQCINKPSHNKEIYWSFALSLCVTLYSRHIYVCLLCELRR